MAHLLVGAVAYSGRWRSSANPVQREDLAPAYEVLLGVLRVCLGREVVEIVPVAQKVITQKEWDLPENRSRRPSRAMIGP
ncbi:MAG: hypothetical protein ACQERF_08710 [Actinomycetota bacterium]